MPRESAPEVRSLGGVPTSSPIRLTRLRVYPLKGAGGYDLLETALDSFGIPLDRRWMLVDARGYFVSQRTHPRLVLIRARPVEDGVRVEAPGMSPIELQAPAPSPGGNRKLCERSESTRTEPKG